MNIQEHITENRFNYFGKYLAVWIISVIFALALAFITRTLLIPAILISLTVISIPWINYKYFSANYKIFPKKYMLLLIIPISFIIIGTVGFYYEYYKFIFNLIAILRASSLGLISTKIEEKLIKLNNIAT